MDEMQGNEFGAGCGDEPTVEPAPMFEPPETFDATPAFEPPPLDLEAHPTAFEPPAPAPAPPAPEPAHAAAPSWDPDHDGVARWDTNNDGVVDYVERDLDHDGVIDRAGIDMDFDGGIDRVGADANHDGHFDTVDPPGTPLVPHPAPVAHPPAPADGLGAGAAPAPPAPVAGPIDLEGTGALPAHASLPPALQVDLPHLRAGLPVDLVGEVRPEDFPLFRGDFPELNPFVGPVDLNQPASNANSLVFNFSGLPFGPPPALPAPLQTGTLNDNILGSLLGQVNAINNASLPELLEGPRLPPHFPTIVDRILDPIDPTRTNRLISGTGLQLNPFLGSSNGLLSSLLAPLPGVSAPGESLFELSRRVGDLHQGI
jgi:hypothetical protein